MRLKIPEMMSLGVGVVREGLADVLVPVEQVRFVDRRLAQVCPVPPQAAGDDIVDCGQLVAGIVVEMATSRWQRTWNTELKMSKK